MDKVTLHGYAKKMAEEGQKKQETNMTETEKVLEERGSRYGSYNDVSTTSQVIKREYELKRDGMDYPITESLDMIANKMARIINGDSRYEDNWVDIIGYATLALESIRGENDKY